MKKLLIIFLCIFLAYPVISSEVTDDYIDIAKNFLNNENKIKAQEYIDLIFLLEPNNEKARTFVELTNPEEENINKDKIVEIKEIPLKIYSDTKSAKLNNQGVDYYTQENIKEALSYFKKALISNKNSHITHYNIALCYKTLGNNLLAECNFKLAHFKNPNFSQSYVGLANITKGDKKLQYLKIAADEHNADANFYLGEYYKNYKNYVLASKYYNEALIIEPNLAIAYYNLGKCYYELEDYDLAIINFKRYLTYISTDDNAHYILGKAYLHLRYDSQALKEFKKAIVLNRKSEYLYILAKLCYYNQQYDTSISILNSILKGEEDSSYYNALGLCYFEKEDMKNALKYFNEALNLDKTSATIYYNISRCYSVLKDKDNENKYIEAIKNVKPLNPQQFADLAIAYYKISDYQSALSTINNAVKYFPGDKKLYKVKMRLCKLTGKTNEYEQTKADLLLKFGVR